MTPTMQEKREQAIAWMGAKWVFHPANRVKKLAEPLPDVFQWTPKVLKGRKGK